MKRLSNEQQNLLGIIAVAILLGVFAYHLGLRFQLQPFGDGANIYDLVLTLPVGVLGIYAVWLLAQRTQATIDAAENGRRTLVQAHISELAGRFQKGLELIDRDGEATRIGGIQILRDVAEAAPNQYGNAVLITMSSLLSRETKREFTDLQSYFWKPKSGGIGYNANKDEDWERQRIPEHETSANDVQLAWDTFFFVLALEQRGDVEEPFTHRRLRNLALCYANDFSPKYMRDVRFEDCIFMHMRSTYRELQGAHFFDCAFLNSPFLRSQLSEAVFTGDSNRKKRSDDLHFIDCDLQSAELHSQHRSITMQNCGVTSAVIAVSDPFTFRDCWYHSEKPHVILPSGYPEPVFTDVSGLTPSSVHENGIPRYNLHA